MSGRKNRPFSLAAETGWQDT